MADAAVAPRKGLVRSVRLAAVIAAGWTLVALVLAGLAQITRQPGPAAAVVAVVRLCAGDLLGLGGADLADRPGGAPH